MAVTKAFVILLYTLLENIHETPLPLQTSQGHRTHRGQKQKGTKKKTPPQQPWKVLLQHESSYPLCHTSQRNANGKPLRRHDLFHQTLKWAVFFFFLINMTSCFIFMITGEVAGGKKIVVVYKIPGTYVYVVLTITFRK